ncbi:MAG TPA: adenosine deaminase [Candidatus Deferrimicrobiaceae bacterium]|nr:adenosine deaminase [Candidatus Deferrimicrobiaceae bacterium]
MPQLATERDITTVPKAELHVHLNGSIREATASTLARRHGEDPDVALRLVDGRYPGHYADFGAFLESYMLANQFVRTPDDLELVAADFARGQAAQHVVYSEAIFTAMIYVRNGMDPSEMWAALRRGLAAGGPETRIGLVVDAIRDLGGSEAQATIDLVEAADAPIVGLCLTGAKAAEPIESFHILREAATRLGMGFQVHAGEMGPPEGIVEALDVLHADRIGHGVQSIRDPELLERLIRDQVPLDVCPSSNVRISLFPTLEAHPVAEFWRRGVNMTISSDDPPFFHTTLTDELRHVVRLAGLSRDDLAELQRRTVRAAFVTPEVKAGLLARIDAWQAEG